MTQGLLQKTGQPQSENDRFMSDVHDLFSGRRSANLYDWLYSSPIQELDVVRGGELLDILYFRCPDYYLYNLESSLIADVADDLAKVIGPHATLIDYGPGPARSFINKTYPVLRSLQAPHGYVPIDICAEYVTACEQEAASRLPGLNVHGIVDDFYDNRLTYKSYEKPVVYFSGSSIANCPEQTAYTFPTNTYNRLLRIRAQLGKRGYLVIGHDTNKNPASLMAAYDNPYLSALIRNVLHRIKRDLPTQSFDPNAFKLWVEWDKDDRCLKMGVQATRGQRSLIGHRRFDIVTDQIFHVASSYKYPAQLFVEVAQTAGFTHEQTFSLTDNPMVMHVFST